MDYTPKIFYDALAANYDSMTEFSRRIKIESSSFRELIDRYNLKSALDAGCGTGFHSFILSQMGMQVTAADVSRAMLNQMRKNARDLGLHVKMVHSSLSGLKTAVREKYDSVFCLGNTLAHILTKKELIDSLRTFYQLLNSSGILLFQILNYDRILKTRERVQSVKEADNKIFIRFYDYDKKQICFNLLTIDKNKRGITNSLISTRLYPWLAKDIVKILRQAKFKNIRLFDTIAKGVFDKRSSKDLVVFAQK
jgi:glycine/sarcosine N-methyltransferase